MLYSKKIVLGFAFLILNTINAKERLWYNASLENDLLNKKLKTFDNYLFFSIKYNTTKNEWDCQYTGDFKPVKISNKNGEKTLEAAYTKVMWQHSPCYKDSQKILPKILIQFSKDSSEIELIYCNSKIIFREMVIDPKKILHIDKYFLSTLMTGQYTNQFESKDSLYFNLNTIQNIDSFNSQCKTNILYSISEFNPLQCNNIASISKFTFQKKIYTLIINFNNTIILTCLNNKENLDIYVKN